MNDASLLITTLDAFTVPVNVGFARGAFDASELVMVVENEASLPRAAASSLSVSSAAGAFATKLSTAVFTNAVVAICVVFVPAVAVGAVGTPVNAGDARPAFNAIALLTDANEASTIVVVALVAIALLTETNDASTTLDDALVAIALVTDAKEASTIVVDAFVAIALATDANEASTVLVEAFKFSADCTAFTWLSFACTFSDKSCRYNSFVLLIS